MEFGRTVAKLSQTYSRERVFVKEHGFCPICGNGLTRAHDGERQRLMCENASCNYIHWDNPTPVVAAILEQSGGVVLTRKKGWPDNWYGLIAGFLEAGETPEEAVLREVREEVGIEGKIEGFVGYYSFFEQNELILAFHVTGQGNIIVGKELEDAKHVEVGKLRPWPFGTGHAVKDWLSKRGSKSDPER